MDTDGSNERQLTVSEGSDKFSEDPVWSPDGEWIVFNSNRDGTTSESQNGDVPSLARQPWKRQSLLSHWVPTVSLHTANSVVRPAQKLQYELGGLKCLGTTSDSEILRSSAVLFVVAANQPPLYKPKGGKA